MLKKIIYAPNVHQGGGKTLLLPLLEALKGATEIAFILDARMPLPEGVSLAGTVHRVKPTLFSRLWCEWQLRYLITKDVSLLCMGNLPPLFAHRGVQQVFVQNRYLIDDVPLDVFPPIARIRLMVERWWLKSRSVYVNAFIVQTSTMQRLVKSRLGANARTLPFATVMDADKPYGKGNKKLYDFLYVASGEPHKNHQRLVEAWIILAGKGIFHSLCLTLNSKHFPELCAWISDKVEKHGLNISMSGECSHDEIKMLYRQSSAMIYPSLFESFGLPLIEAVSFELPVLASNSSYVADVIVPSSVFDPTSSQSIAESVQTFPGTSATLNISLYDANSFLAQAFKKADSN